MGIPEKKMTPMTIGIIRIISVNRGYIGIVGQQYSEDLRGFQEVPRSC